MLWSRPIFNIIILLFLISLICVSGLADSAPPRSCMVLVTATSGGSVQPEGAITVPYGSGVTLTFTPSSGYLIQTILVDGSDAGQYPSISLSSVVHDMTVHVIFIPEGRSLSEPVSPMADSPPPSSGSSISSPYMENQTGECSGTGCTSEKAITVGPSGADYTRIQDAITNASPRDTIYIDSGTYAEQITIQKPVSLIGLQGGSGRPVILSEENGSIITVSADDVLIRNLSVANARGDQDNNAAIIGTGISDFTLQNCVISDSGTGVNLNGIEDISIRDCIIRNNSQIGMLLSSMNRSIIKGNLIERSHIGIRGDQLSGLTFRDNLISSNDQQGVIFRSGLSDTEISGNMFTENGQEKRRPEVDTEDNALYLEYANNVTISGNNLTQNHGTALTLDEVVRTTLTNNTFFGNYAGFTYAGNIPDPGNWIDASNLIDGLPIVYYEGVSGENIEDISPSTLYLQNCTNMTIRGLTLKTRNGYGILVKGGSDITISNCSVGENLYQNILIAEVVRGNINGSEVSNGSQYGIGLINTVEFGVSDCRIQGNSIGVAVRGNTSFVNVMRNTFLSNDVGFQVEMNNPLFGFGKVSGNKVEGGRIGFSIEGGRGGIIEDNEMSGVQGGVHFSGTDGLKIEDNHIDALDTGLRISGLHPDNNPYLNQPSFGNSVKHNSFSAGNYPISINDTMEWVFGNTLILNDFVIIPGVSSNITPWKKAVSTPFSWGGVSISASLVSAISNKTSQPSREANSWDTGERVRYSYNNTTFSGSLGNHWSYYVGSEIGTSGIGDLPVQINGDNSDKYPLTGEQNQYIIQDNRYHLGLYPGWNFISTPSVLMSGSNTARIFEMVDTAGHSMYSFNNSTWESMKGEDPIVPLHGYWIYSGIGVSVPLSFDPGTIPTPVHLLPGWNAIGYPGIQQAVAYDALSSLDASWSYAVGFNTSLQTYEEPIIRETRDNEIMYPSRGYWLYMNQGWDLQPITG